MDKLRKNTKPIAPIVLKANDRAKVLGNIPKPGRDFANCCYTLCTRC